MNKNVNTILLSMCVVWLSSSGSQAQIVKLADHRNNQSEVIGTFQGITFHEAGFSGLYPIPGTGGKEFWTVSDRGVNVDAANANPAGCTPTYDKIYGFPSYAPKIHRIRLNADKTIQILQTITLKRPDGTTASGLLNPAGFGSTASEIASTDTVMNCDNFNTKTVAKDIWGIDSEGIVVDRDGNFWICEEGGPTIWKVAPNGVVIKRFTPYANLFGSQSIDVQIDSVFKYRKNNRGFEGIALAPNGKVYAIIQSPVLYPTKSVGEGTKIHRILEIDPATNANRMFAYVNDGIIGSGSNQIRLRDWKIGDMVAVNDTTFLVIEAAARGTSDFKRIYKINLNGATPVTSGLYNGKTLEGLVDEAGLTANGIVPVRKTLVLDLLANGWPAELDKAEGLAIINDSTIAVGNDNDYGQFSPAENGVATATGKLSHVITYRLQGANKLSNYVSAEPKGTTGPSTAKSPYVTPAAPGVKTTSILTAGDVVNGYTMAGTPDGTGAFDNGDGTFTLLVNHEFGNGAGKVHAHGQKGAFVSKWVINKSDLSVVSGADLIQNVNVWNGAGYTTFNAANPSPLASFGRFCSADLASVSAFYNTATGKGSKERIFLNGEESGSEGRGFAHIATGPEAGTSYEVPRLGKYSYENAVASPASGDKTVVVGLDDATPGQLYIYVGSKTTTGNEVEKAGLTNGTLYGVAVTGLVSETNGSVPAPGTPFTLASLGNVENMTGAALNAASTVAGVTTFLRPEDGAWDPQNPRDFYFVTTNGFANPSRLWRLRFTDITNPELGGTITAVLEGTEGQKMMDNLGMDNFGHILIQEDVGNNPHIGKTWQYTIATDELKLIAAHDENRFLAGSPYFLTQDEEASGIIDASEILGAGHFLLVDQAHYGQPGELVEGGQILALFNPDTYNATPVTGPSSSQSPYVTPVAPGVKTTSILTAGDVVNGYKMTGIPDGTGAYDNGDGTFTLLVNHEIPANGGGVRAHGQKGAFVSKWVINKSDLSVVSGSDLIQHVNVWNGTGYTTYNTANPSPLAALGRFCSADLASVSAFYNAATGKGTRERLFFNGEETGNEGRGFAHIATGPDAGTSYEIPRLGKYSYENAVASPASGDKTVVVGLDDATPGQVYVYIGSKTSSGSEIEKAGLTNGTLYGVAVSGLVSETNESTPAPGTVFTLANLGNVENTTGAALNAASTIAGVTTFLRPEDGAWDPQNPNDFYFVTTNGFANPSRLWRLRFTDITNPELGGTITAVLDGTEGQRMMDNIGMDNFGHILIQEDVGNNAHIGKTWQYTIATDEMKLIAAHDTRRFILGSPNFLTQDEEGSGIIDASEILGPGHFLLVDQAHYPVAGEQYEGGQILALYNPESALNLPVAADISKNGTEDSLLTIPASDFAAAFSDADGDSLASVKIISIPANGTLTVNGNAVATGQVIPASQANVVYTPAQDFNGKDSLSFRVNDGLSTSAKDAKIRISLAPVNDAPVVSDFSKTTAEDVVLSFTASDFISAYADVEGKQLDKITVITLPSLGKLKLNGVDIKAGQVIGRSKLSGISFVPNLNTFGSTSFTWKASDAYSYSAPASVSVTIEGGNDAPVISDFVKTTPKNATVFLQAENFAAAYFDDEGKAIDKITIVSLPASGKLKLNADNLRAGQVIGASKLSQINFVPAPGFQGTVSFQWKASDFVNYSNVANVFIKVGNQAREEEEGAEYTELTVSPVPASEKLDVKFFSSGGRTEISIVDATSNAVLNKTVNAVAGTNLVELNVENLTPGMYFLNVVSGGKKSVRTVVISGK